MYYADQRKKSLSKLDYYDITIVFPKKGISLSHRPIVLMTIQFQSKNIRSWFYLIGYKSTINQKLLKA